MNANKIAVISLELAGVRALQMRGSGLETLRGLAGAGIRPLGHDLGAGYAFLAFDCSGAYAGTLREVVRSLVWLPGAGALIDFDITVAGDAPVSVNWKPEGAAGAGSVSRVLPRRGKGTGSASETLLLNVIWTGAARPIAEIDSIDLAGVRIGDQVVAFNIETKMARSAVSFDVDGDGSLKVLVTGLAPGEWEVWSGGMLDIPDAEVKPEAGALFFEGRPGGYFLRRLGS